MSNVTVFGADNSVLTVSLDGTTNYLLAQQFAALVNGAAAAGTLSASILSPGTTVGPVPAGFLGEAVVAAPLSSLAVPPGDQAVIDIAAGPATISATSSTGPVSVLAGSGGTTFNAGPALNWFVAGSGDNTYNGYVSADGATTLPGAGSANLSMVATGPGNDTITAGTENFDIDPGTGRNMVTLGTGISYVNSLGQDLITGGPVHQMAGVIDTSTIYLSGTGATVIGGSAPLDIIDGNLMDTPGGGGDLVTLGSGGGTITDVHDSTFNLAGNASVTAGGNDTINVAGANATVRGAPAAAGGVGSTFVNGPTGTGTLLFIGGSGNATVAGGSAVLTVGGATGGSVTFTGDTSGNVFMVSDGMGANATLIDASQASGANTFVSGVATAGAQEQSTVLGGTGANLFLIGNGPSSLVGGVGAANTFELVASNTGGATDVIGGFRAGDKLAISGYAVNGSALLAGASISGGGTTITLSDQTKIVLQDYTGLSSGNFI